MSYYNGKTAEPYLAATLLLSAGLHALLAALVLFLAPYLGGSKKNYSSDTITVQLLGSLSPPAPAAPEAPVDPNLKGPDVVEIQSSPVPVPVQPAVEPTPIAAPPDEVIPLGPQEKPPVLVNRPVTPPVATPPVAPPRVETKPPVKPKPAAPSDDDRIKKAMAELARKKEADQLDEAINGALVNISRRQGAGRGESAEDGGGASSGQRLDPEKAAYYQHVHDIVKANWQPPAGFSISWKAAFTIKVEPGGGQVVTLRLDHSSGNAEYDESVERAIRKSILPPLPPIFGGRYDAPRLEFGAQELSRR